MNCTTSKINTYDNLRTQKIEYRDSLCIMYTIKLWVDSNSPGFGSYSEMYEISNSQVKYYFGGTFYSPDKKKIIVWIIDKEPNIATKVIYDKKNPAADVNKLCGASGDTVYGGTAIIGFRNDSNEIWNLYPLCNYTVSCYSSKAEVINLMGQYYFGSMKYSCPADVYSKNLDTTKYGGEVRWDLERRSKKYGLDYVSGAREGGYVLENLGYNLQEKDFWDQSLLWEKGATVKGYYLFQLAGNGEPDETNPAIKMPKINYPNSILKLFSDLTDSKN
ncbi:MAG: hypothetical protein ABI199_04960 [Bacteroidia bacterium]